MAWLGGVRVVLITDRRMMGDGSVRAFGDAVARAVAALPLGAALVQVREKDLDGRVLLQLVHAAMASGAPVMVNDRLDVALAAGAAGVHLPETGLSVSDVRQLAPAGFLIGCSVHAQPAAAAARARPAVAASPSRSARDIDKAIREYLRIVLEDPKDVRVWLKIADLYAAKGALDDATTTYGKVARFYEAHGFQLKAIAVYKQLLRLDPSLVEPTRRLVALYREVGLTNDAEIVERSLPAEYPRADLIQLGPIFETPGKGPALGATALRAVRTALPAQVRLVAVGGVTDAARAAACRAAGADAVAAIRTAWSGGAAALA